MMRELDRKLIRDLLHMRGQVLAVALVVASGIGVFLGMLSVYDSLQATRDEYYERNRLADVFASLQRAPLVIAERLRHIEGVEVVEDRIVKDVSADVPGLDEPATARIVSIPRDPSTMLNALHLRTGRWIEPGADAEVIISEAFAGANGLTIGDSIGAALGGRWQSLRIVGTALSPEYIYEVATGGGMFPDNRRFGVVWMSHDAMRSAFGMTGAFNDVVIAIERGAEPQSVVGRVDRMLAPYGCVASYPRKDQLSYAFIDEELSQLRANGIYLPVIFMAIAAFLLNIVIGRLIAMQRDQIGVLKAFGYSNTAVGMHYMKMCVAIVLFGSVLGLALGVWIGQGITELYAEFFRFPYLTYRLDGGVIAAAIGSSVLAGAAGASGAVLSAVAMPPAEAMRPASPARFRPGVLESMGFESLLATRSRLILRNVERNPWKAAISVIGISVAIGLLMLGEFARDSVDFMGDVQFRMIQREDIVAVFATPRPRDVVSTLAGYPGVLRVEPFRSLPARVHAAHRSRTIQIIAVDDGAELRRIVDTRMTVVTPAAEGLTMTTTLGEVLGVDVGDTVDIEVLEGRRRTRRVRIGAFVDEVLGMQAYMRRASIDQLAGAPAISGAYLLVDEDLLDELYRKLKHTPGVSGAMVREVAIKGFDEVVAESQNISRLIIVIAAAVISIGIVYNSARIALSERGRELASLRVLGFTKREVTGLLLGEQAMLTLLAMPPGYFVGYGFVVLISLAYEGEMFRLPVIVTTGSFIYSISVVSLAAVVSGLFVRRRLRNLDLIEVLKTRE